MKNSGLSPAGMKKLVFDHLKQIASIIDRAITEENQSRILGDEILGKVRTSDGRVPAGSVINLALFNDCLSVVEIAIDADGAISPEEIEKVHPLVATAAWYYARAIPRRYQGFAQLSMEQTMPFLEFHRDDDQIFGGRSNATRWLGLAICQRTADASDGREPLEQYRDLMLRLMDEITSLGGVSPEEQREREKLQVVLGLKDRLRASEQSIANKVDGRLRAFTSTTSPEVFHAIAHTHQVWERDPFDVETIHPEARDVFSQLLDRASTEGQEFGRTLLILGESGSGKTHLMRAFRSTVHGQRRGFAGYLQMSSRTDNYARYVLLKLIDSLERPFDPPEVEDSGILCISNALVETPGLIDPELLRSIRDDELSVDELAARVSKAADSLLVSPALEEIDIDFLRVLIYLQRRDPRIKGRALKYFKASDLTPHDRELLGHVEPKNREEDPARMIESFGRVIGHTGQGSLVILVDQLEDVFVLDEAKTRFRRAMDVLRSITDDVPSSIVVIACLHDFYTALRPHLRRAVLDRIEEDPKPVHLTSQRKLEEIEALVSKRLSYLYDHAGVTHRPEEPTFPFRSDQLGALTNLRTRDVLDWCREYQQRCIAAEELVEPPVAVAMTTQAPQKPVLDLAQEWNDLLAEIDQDGPDGDDETAGLLASALAAAADELVPKRTITASTRGRFVSVSVGGSELLAAICNRNPQGGGLGRQIAEVEKEAGKRTPVLVRCSEYPANPRSQVAKQLGQLIAKGGRRVVMEETDWRTIRALLRFKEEHGREEAFAKWRVEERPLSRLKALRDLLGLEEDQPIANAAPSASAPAPEKAAPEKKVERIELPATLVIGNTRALTPEVVMLDPKLLPMHAAFLGSTGSGKTTVALNIIEQLAMRGVPSILVDRKGDLAAYAKKELWEKPAELPEHEERRRRLRELLDVQVFTPGDPQGRPLSIPVIPPGLAELPAHEQSKVARYAATALGGMMNYRESGTDQTRLGILGKAIELLGQTANDGMVTLAHVVELLHQQDPGLVNAIGRLDTKHFAKLIDNLETLRITRGDLLATGGERLSADLLLGTGEHAKPGRTRMSIVSTKFLGDNASIEFWVSRMIVEVARWANKNPKQALQAVLLFDEADVYLPATRKPATKEPLMDLLRRARSAGISVLLATQSPGDLDYKCRDNIRTWFVGRVAQKTAIDKMKPLLSDCRVNVSSRLANAGTGEFFQIAEGDVVDLKADRSFMRTEQLPEQEILRLAVT